MDLLFYIAMGLIALASVAAFGVICFLIGKRRGAKEYYNLLSEPREESLIQ